jgi:hypothetical protein
VVVDVIRGLLDRPRDPGQFPIGEGATLLILGDHVPLEPVLTDQILIRPEGKEWENSGHLQAHRLITLRDG